MYRFPGGNCKTTNFGIVVINFTIEVGKVVIVPVTILSIVLPQSNCHKYIFLRYLIGTEGEKEPVCCAIYHLQSLSR